MGIVVERKHHGPGAGRFLHTLRQRRIAGITLLTLALGFLAVLALNRGPESVTAERRDIVGLLPLGRSEVVAPPYAHAEIAAPFQSSVAKVYASVGQRVREGETLLELSDASTLRAYEQARREVRQAESELETARKQQDRAVQLAEQQLARTRVGETVVVATTDAGPAGTVIIPDPSTAPTTVVVRTEDRQAAEQAVLDARAARENALNPLRTNLEAARTRLAEAERVRKGAQIRAAISGTVLELNARPGEEVGEDKTPVATIVDLEKLQVHVPFAPEEFPRMKEGLPVVLTLSSLPGESFTGKVARITTEPGGRLNPSRQVAILTFENRGGLVKPEMLADIAVKFGEARNVLAVPNDAIGKDSEGRPIVHVLRNNEWQPVIVESGIHDEKYTAIKKGLNEGDTVQIPRRPFSL